MRKIHNYREFIHVPVFKGRNTAFTCGGCWFDLSDPKSMDSLAGCLGQTTSIQDRQQMYVEIITAINRLQLTPHIIYTSKDNHKCRSATY